MEEKYVVNAVKKYLSNLKDVDFVSTEEKLIENGLACDLIGRYKKEIKYIVECKGKIAPGGSAGGLGQALQYKFQYEKQNNKNLKKTKSPTIIFACPKSREKILDTLKIDKGINRVLLVDESLNIEIYNQNKKLNQEKEYYIYDTVYLESFKINRLKKILEVLMKIHDAKNKKIEFKKNIINAIGSINDERNLLISPRALGLVNQYTLTKEGYELYIFSKENEIHFKRKLCEILKPNLSVVLNGIISFIKNNSNKNSLNDFTITNKKLELEIEKFYKHKKIKHFDFRRLGYMVDLLVELDFLKEIKKGNYEFKKASLY